MTHASDISALFSEFSHKADTYPENIIRTEKFGHTLKDYKYRLSDGSDTAIFRIATEQRPIAIWDLVQNENKFRTLLEIKSDDLDVLRQTMHDQMSDPRCRFIFLQTTNSRGPLCCTRDQFCLIFTHYQVIPSAMDLFLELRNREKPISITMFRHENYLSKLSAGYALPALNRSGLCIQHAFNVLGYEHETHPNEDPWPLRHVLAYHCFDLVTGTSTWIVVKGNKVMRKRIMTSTASYLEKHQESSKTVEASFISSLRIHLLLLEWCAENLTQYIDSLDEKSHKFAARVKISPVARMAGDIPNTKAPSRHPTWDMNKSQSRNNTGLSQTSQTVPRSTIDRVISNFSSRVASGLSTHLTQAENNQKQTVQTPEPVKVKDVQLEDIFSFDDLQSLHNLADEVDKANTVLDQNKKVLSELRENYNSITESENFRQCVDFPLCVSDISNFLQRVKGLEADLDSHQCRIRTLLRSLEKDENLFNGILQYQSMRTGEFFSESAHKSAATMEDLTKKMGVIAVQTKHETVSMHVITGLTLVFLPGTFVATFFSSNIVDFDKGHGTTDIGDWSVRMPALKLFLAMCIPLMAVTLSIWLFFYRRTKKQNSAVAILETYPSTEKLPVTEEV